MGNTESTYQEKEPARVVVVNLPAQTVPLMIPSDDVILRRHRNYGDVDRVFAVSYTYSATIPNIEQAQREFDAGLPSQPGAVAMLQKTWQQRKGKDLAIDNISADNLAPLKAVTVDSRVLLIGDIGEKSVALANGQSSVEPVLFGTNASHSAKDLADVLVPYWREIATKIDKCLHINLYYAGAPCVAFVSRLIDEMARENIYICVRATDRESRESPRQCAFYFNKLALRQFDYCPE